jgi:hypothetical protein
MYAAEPCDVSLNAGTNVVPECAAERVAVVMGHVAPCAADAEFD